MKISSYYAPINGTQKHEVTVTNIGKVFSGWNADSAISVFWEYVRKSRAGEGRAAGEDVVLFKDGEIIREHNNKTRRG